MLAIALSSTCDRHRSPCARPSEIVYTIHLPLVNKASQVVLDVSER
jgi:hypothetical protein